ncbi:hypothetical protein [Inquilinus sp. OTU3971]|uniref:hypothetical protein n=1 Tax=Inquilinus sp. OTU3971 TaxID=3043855 RepID=UPI00313D31B5
MESDNRHSQVGGMATAMPLAGPSQGRERGKPIDSFGLDSVRFSGKSYKYIFKIP